MSRQQGGDHRPRHLKIKGRQAVLPVPVYELPAELLRYTLPSRYCDSDKLFNFAWKHFGQIANGHERVQAICDWVHNNIEYRYGSGRPDLSASEAIEQRYSFWTPQVLRVKRAEYAQALRGATGSRRRAAPRSYSDK